MYSPKTWPPNVEDLGDDELKPPDSITFFLQLKPSDNCTPNINRIVDCISQDNVFNILCRKTALQKYFLLGLELYSLVGSRNVYWHFAWIWSFVLASTMSAKLKLLMMKMHKKMWKEGSTLPLQPKYLNKTHFWSRISMSLKRGKLVEVHLICPIS